MTPAEVVQQLFQCCDDDLGNAVLKTSPAAVEGTEDVSPRLLRESEGKICDMPVLQEMLPDSLHPSERFHRHYRERRSGSRPRG